MSALKTEIGSLKQTDTDIMYAVNELQEFRQSISDYNEHCNSHNKTSSQNWKYIKLLQGEAFDSIHYLQLQNPEQNEEFIELNWTSMRDNLVFVGIPENYAGNAKNTNYNVNIREKSGRKFLKEKMKTKRT